MKSEGNSQVGKDIFIGSSEMAALMHFLDWQKTPLGVVEIWPQSLKTAIGIMLGSRYPIFICWGDSLITFYNDACIPLLGKNHPQVLGYVASRVWGEVWDNIGCQIKAVLGENKFASQENLRLIVEGNGCCRESYFTFDYSPILDDDGDVGGVFCTCIQENDRQLSKLGKNLNFGESALEIEAQTAQAHLEGVLSNIRDGFVIFDYNWRFTYVNDREIEIIGMKREEILGKNVWQVIPDLIGTEIEQRLRQVMVERKSTQFEYCSPNANRWFDIRVYPTAEGIAAITVEITEGKQAALALGESEARFRQMAQTIENVFWLFDLQTQKYLYISPAYEKIWGRSCELLYADSRAWLERVHPDDRNRLQDVWQRCIEKGSQEEEYRIIRPDGSIRWVRDRLFKDGDGDNRSFVVNADKGQSYGLAGVTEDITEQKQIESALRESELNFRTLADSMPQIFWTGRPDGFVEYYNQRWFDYTGMTLEQTQGWGWQPLLHPDDVQMCVDVWSESVRTGNEYNIEYRFRRASDGQYRWFLGRAIPLNNENGQIVKWFGSSTDIHDQKCARKAAEQANRIKDEFLAVLSHELRTPLNPILGWAKILQKGNINPEKTKIALETIERNAILLTQLIDDLLDVSQIFRGKLSLDQAPVNLETVIKAALETVGLAAEAKSITIHTLKASSVGMVKGDAVRLQQVMWNLLSNAVKFTASGGHIWITLTQVDNYAQIQVKDTGKGIKREFLSYIFEHFRQEDSATTRQFGGLGLGLAIVRQIVELHGGTVTAESPGEGQGAIFTVKIPCLSVLNHTITSSEVNQPSLSLSGINILVVDDEPDSGELIAFILQEEGATVTATGSASAALESIAKSIPDLLISDIGMPDIDGYELIRRIRALDNMKAIPAIAVTAYAGQVNQQQAISVGFQAHISKPFDVNAVVDMVIKLVRN